MINAVLDTNIIISSVFWRGNPYKVVRRGLLGEYKVLTSKEILDEVADKLRNKFNFLEDSIKELIDILMGYGNVVETSSKFDVVRDKKDNKVLECAFDGRANYIVSGDPDLLEIKEFRGIKIISAKEFLEVLKSIHDKQG